jgi:spore coat protein A, manganese oxidase
VSFLPFHTQTTRRAFAQYGAAGLAAVVFGGAGAWRAYASGSDGFDALRDRFDPCFDGSPVARPFAAMLSIPPAVTGGAVSLTERRGETEIIPGIRTPVWGYDGRFPGPTILARKLRPVTATFTNALPPGEDPGSLIVRTPQDADHPFRASSTVVHLHGINTDARSDGYPEDTRLPGQSATHVYPNNDYQRPATLWYHDHSVHITSPHVYRGLAGFYLLQDQLEDALGLPGTVSADGARGYGVFDIPLLLKDVMIDPRSGILIYDNCSHTGALGDVMTVNGKQQPRFAVANRKYRFRILNGSDQRQYLLALRRLSNVSRDPRDPGANEPLTLIGTDQGLLPAPEGTTTVHTTPAERHEIVVDFARHPVGTRLVLVNLLVDPDKPKLFPLMAFDVSRTEPDPSRIPPVLRGPEHPADTQPPARTRLWRFDRQGGYWSINGKQWDPARVDAFPVVNTTEEWVLENRSGGWGHPIHPHLGRFRIVRIEGRAPTPGELTGFHDVVWLGPNQRIRIVHQFWNFTGRFAYHCHNGSHEDHDMMTQFEVQPG